MVGTSGQTICTISTTNGGGTALCSGWADYNTASSFSPTTVPVSGNEQWKAYGTISFTDTTGGNTHTVKYYNQLQNTYKATPQAPATWDAVYNIPVTGTVGGTAGTTGCTIATSSGGGAVSCASWFDYSTVVTVTSPVTSGSERWIASGANTFTQATGGNTNNVNYYKQYTNTFQVTALAQTTFDASMTADTVTGTYLGTASSTICTFTPVSGASTASCSGYSDANAAASFPAALNGAPANSRWENAAGAASNTASITSGGGTLNINYYKQWYNTFSFSPALPTTWDAAFTGTATGTYLGATGYTICTASLASGGGAISCTGYSDNNAAVTFATITDGTYGRWQPTAASSPTAAITSGGATKTGSYYKQLQNTYQVTPASPTTWDAAFSIPVTGTYLGTTSSTICTITTTSGGGASSSGCANVWADYNTAVSLPPSIADGSNTQWTGQAPLSFTQTTGGNNNNVNYYKQYKVTFAQSGLDSTATGTVVTVSGTAVTYSSLPYSVWVNSGSSVTFTWTSPVTSGTTGKQFRLSSSSQTSPYTVSGAVTITGTYTTQYQVTFAVSPSGGGSTSPAGTSVWENAGALSISATPSAGYKFSQWTASGSITFGNSGSASTTATISGTGTITANFQAYGIDCTSSLYTAAANAQFPGVTLSNCKAGDIIIVVVSENSASGSVTSVRDGSGNTYTSRGSEPANGLSLFEYYYVTSAVYSPTITITLPSSHSWVGRAQAFGISGVITTLLFDSGSSFPLKNTGTSGTPTVTGITTTTSSDIIIAIEADTRGSAQTVGSIAGSAATAVNLYNSSSLSVAVEYRIVSSTYSGQSATFGTSSSGAWVMMVDAIDPLPVSAPQTSSVPVSGAGYAGTLSVQPPGFGILAALLAQLSVGASDRRASKANRFGKNVTRTLMNDDIFLFKTWIQNTERIYPMNEARGKV